MQTVFQRGSRHGPEPLAKKGFIKHHEQINELKAGVHKDMSCIDCHNPHKRAILAEAKCAECHEDVAKSCQILALEKNIMLDLINKLKS